MRYDVFLPEVSIIIAARNAEKELPITLHKLKSIDYPREKMEVIVVNDNSNDNTASVAYNLCNKVITRNVRGGCSGARNTGIVNSGKEILVFIDTDVFVTKDWLEKLVQPFKDDMVWATGGFINNIINDNNSLSKYIQYNLEYRKRSKYPKSVPGSNSAFRKIVFEKLGLLNTDLEGSEDTEISYRILNAGYKLVFVEDAIVYHPFPSSLIVFFRKAVLYAKNRTIMYAKGTHLLKKDEHSPWFILIQPIMLFIVSLLACIFKLYEDPILLLSLIILPIMVFNSHFLYIVLKKDIYILPNIIFYLCINAVAWFLGMIYGLAILMRNFILKTSGKSNESTI